MEAYHESAKMSDIPKDKYPTLHEYAEPIREPKRRILGREQQVQMLLANMYRPLYANSILLGNAGVGKTAIVKELAREDPHHLYFGVDLHRMASAKGAGRGSGSVEMAARMKNLMNELIRYQKNAIAHHKRTIVIFMDEFHSIEQISPAAAQAIKPLLGESGPLGLKVIAATTFGEYNKYILPDAALTQRLPRVSIESPSDKVVVEILRAMKHSYVPDVPVEPHLFNRIVKVTNKYLPAQSQPRKSLRVLDAMIGYYEAFHTPLDERLLNLVLLLSHDIRVDWKVNVRNLRQYLDSRVIDQHAASHILAQHIYMSVAHMSSRKRPQGSFLFTGSTGVGKTEMAKALTKALLGNEDKMIRFDMANFTDRYMANQFRDELTMQVATHPNWVILFDEVEKADKSITRILLPVLDDGELKDANGRTVSFRNSYIIMTTNAAQEVFHEMQKYRSQNEAQQRKIGAGNWISKYRRLIKTSLTSSYNQFPTELVNRLDDFIPFAPLSISTERKIADMNLREVANRAYREHGVKLHYAGDDKTCYLGNDGKVHHYYKDKYGRRHRVNPATNKHPYRCGVVSYLVNEKGNMNRDTNNGGARGLKRNIDQSITSKVSELICLRPDIKDIAVYRVGNMHVNNFYSLYGDAYLGISPYQPPVVHHHIQKQPMSRLGLAHQRAARGGY